MGKPSVDISTSPSTTQAQTGICAACRQINADVEIFETNVAEWTEVVRCIEENLASVPNTVMLDVDGTTFKTAKDTLLRVEGSYFHVLLGSVQWHPDTCGNAYFLDLDPYLFRHVLASLRNGTCLSDTWTWTVGSRMERAGMHVGVF